MSAPLDLQRLRRRLRAAPAQPLLLGYSGGRDSHVLLHAVWSLGLPLRALHVDHGLHPDSRHWAEHCTAVCRELDVPLELHRVAVDVASPRGPEAAAREARYRLFEAALAGGGTLLLAHHRDDQAETVLLRLLRGAGPRGLAAMAALRGLGGGWLLRPLLDVPGAALQAHALAHGLAWVDDPGNADPQAAERNLLRHEVLPRLRARRPGLDAALARAASLQRETAELLDAVADQDLGALERSGALDLAGLRALPEARRLAAVRRWLQLAGRRPPGRERFRQGIADLLEAAADRRPELIWEDARLCRYRGRLHLLPPRLPDPPAAPLAFDPARGVRLPGLGRVWAEPAGAGLDPALLARGDLSLDFRRGGERCRLPGRGSRDLRRLFQELDLPPWERDRLPLLRVGGQLAAVGDRLVCEGYGAPAGAGGWRLRWDW